MASDTYLATAGNTLIGIHNTLSGTTADTVTVESNAPQALCRCEILNRSTINTIYITHNTGATAVAAADGTVAILPGQAITTPPAAHHVLSIVGSGDAYSVHRLPDGTVE